MVLLVLLDLLGLLDQQEMTALRDQWDQVAQQVLPDQREQRDLLEQILLLLALKVLPEQLDQQAQLVLLDQREMTGQQALLVFQERQALLVLLDPQGQPDQLVVQVLLVLRDLRDQQEMMVQQDQQDPQEQIQQ